MTAPHPTLVIDQLCSDDAALVCVEVELEEVLVPEALDDDVAVAEAESLPTKALSLVFSTKDALTVPLLHSDGLVPLPSTKFTATHYRVHSD